MTMTRNNPYQFTRQLRFSVTSQSGVTPGQRSSHQRNHRTLGAGTLGAGTLRAGTLRAGTLRAGTLRAGTLRAGTLRSATKRYVLKRGRSVDALQSVLPRHLPHLTGWELAGRHLPAEKVGGDFYDLIPLADGRIGVLIGDVAGKGVTAAVIMAMARSILRTEAMRGDDPADVLRQANDAIAEVMPQGHFLTALYLVIDPASGSLQMANAGHNLPWVRTESAVHKVEATGLPLGLFTDVVYEEIEAYLPAGASMILYSDGITEARNEVGRLFTSAGLCRVIGALEPSESPESFVNSILAACSAHTGSTQHEDDIALLVLKRH